MSPENWAAILTALGVGTLISEIVRAIIKAVSGRVGRERSGIEYEVARRKQVEKDADEAKKKFQQEIDNLDHKADGEIVKRRIAEAKAARYERLLILNGIIPSRETWTDETALPDRKEVE
jgi:hypothetical protein